ncbi:MAG: hypothetical protein K6U80_18225 [Firmicutes bacterium]|nr:hypothetical protein [Bacillota bacterium]
MRPLYCFIDDSPFELALFQDIFPKAIPGVEFICASSFNDCKQILDGRSIYPSLFILDLYGGAQENAGVSIPAKAELEARTQKFLNLNHVYQDLESIPDDLKINEFLKRLFTIVSDWRELFADVCQTVGQGRHYGIENLQQVKKHYPMAGVVFYTRKAIFPDALALNRLGCFDIFMKPPGRNNEEIRIKTQEQSQGLIAQWNETVRKNYIIEFEGQLIKKETENGWPIAFNSEAITLINIMKNLSKPDLSIETELKRIFGAQPSIFDVVFDIPAPFIEGFKVWLAFYYDIDISKI